MTDGATKLEERFASGALWFLEKWETYGVNLDGDSISDVLTDEDDKAIDLF